MGISFDERDAARAGISKLTGETVPTKATCEKESKEAGDAVNPSIMSEAGYGTVELLAPVLWSCRCLAPAAGTETTEQREARCFTASPLGCLVQFTHSGNFRLGPRQAALSRPGLPPTRLLA